MNKKYPKINQIPFIYYNKIKLDKNNTAAVCFPGTVTRHHENGFRDKSILSHFLLFGVQFMSIYTIKC